MNHLLIVTDEVQNVLLQLQQHHSVPATTKPISIRHDLT